MGLLPRGLAFAALLALPGGLLAVPEAPPALTPRAQATLLTWARQVLGGLRPVDQVPPEGPFELDQDLPTLLALSVFHPGEATVVGLARGGSVRAAFAGALLDLAPRLRARFGPQLLRRIRLQVDRLGAPRGVGRVGDPRLPTALEVPGVLRPARDAVRIRGGAEEVLVLPHDLALRGAFDGGFPRADRVLAALGSADGGTGRPGIREVEILACRTFAEGAQGAPRSLFEGIPHPPEPTPGEITRTLEAASQALHRAFLAPAELAVVADPRTGGLRRQRGGGVPWLAINALLELALSFPDREGATRVATHHLEGMLASLRPVELRPGQRELVPRTEGSGSLGTATVALAVRALALAGHLPGTSPRLDRARASLGRVLLFLGRPDGSWYPDLPSAASGSPPLRPLRKIPGLGLLALADLAALEPEGPWREAADRVAARLATDLGRGAALDHWAVQGLGRHARLSGNRATGRAALRVARTYLLEQEARDPGPNLGATRVAGAPFTPGATARVAGALREARLVAWLLGEDPRSFDAALVRAGRYLAGRQFRAGALHVFRRPSRARGGFPFAPGDPRVRADDLAHGVRALLGVVETLRGERPRPLLAEALERADQRLKVQGL